MVKRPLVIIFTIYVLGILMGRYSGIKTAGMLAVSIVIFGVSILWFLLRNYKGMNWDLFLLVLPLVLYLGFAGYQNQYGESKIDGVINQKVEAKVTGKLVQIEQKANTDACTLMDCKVIINNQIFKAKKILVYISSCDDNLIGNILECKGSLSKFQKSTNPGQFNEYEYYKSKWIGQKLYATEVTCIKKIPFSIHRVLNQIKEKIKFIYDTTLSEEDTGIMKAMVLGDKANLSKDIQNVYQENGISHILAISGLHISLIGMTIFTVLRKLKGRLELSVIITIIFLFLYGILTNFSVSTNRAVVMLSLSLIAKILGRTYDVPTAISLSGFIILFQSPMLLFSAGCQLSFVAVIAIVIMYPSLKMETNKSKILDTFLVSISINLFTLPILLFNYYEFPTYSAILNLFILPLMSILVILALCGGVIGLFCLPLGHFLMGGVHYILWFYKFICTVFSKLPFHELLVGCPSNLQILVFYGILILFVLIRKKYSQRVVFCMLFLLLFIFVKPKENILQMTMLDIGQGDCIFMEINNDTTVIVDGGSTDVKDVYKYRVLPFLKYEGKKEVDYIFISHFDEDHISAIRDLFMDTSISVKNLVLPKLEEMDEPYNNMITLALEKCANIIYLQQGDEMQIATATLICHYPVKGLIPKNRNDGSFVFTLTYGSLDILFTGDIEMEGETSMEEITSLKAVDILKVAHHGSNSSTTDSFLNKVNPKYALISCGHNNRYGHPNKEVLERLSSNDTEIFITTNTGAITVISDGKLVKFKKHIEKFK